MVKRVIIIGGGAGGLELASKLGRKLGRDQVFLVDSRLYHIWKPSLHEVAAGTLDMHQEGLSYSMLAHERNFTFIFGTFTKLDTVTKEITVSAFETSPGEVLIPERTLQFSTLCIAVGSTSNYFNTPGAAEHTISLNSPEDAERFRYELLKRMTLVDARKDTDPDARIKIVIIGGGATGVELAAELREASNTYMSYGFYRLNPTADVQITVMEGAPRILAPLPERVSKAATALLEKRSIRVVAGCRASSIGPTEVIDATGARYPVDICVWAAGIKAPEFLATLGLSTNKGGQLEVGDRLNVNGHNDIFAFGDCAACMDNEGRLVPPRAQAAHQQASYLYSFLRHPHAENALPDKPYVYRDYGSLVSVGTQTGVGNLMGSLSGSSWFVQGLVARTLYMSLHLMHHAAVLGWVRTAGLAIARALIRRTTALVKLH